MKQQKSNHTPTRFSSQHILELGENLAHLPTYREQKKHLINFLEKHFGHKAFVYITHPYKTSQALNQPDELPVNINAIIDTKDYSTNHHYIKIEEDSSWLVVPLVHGVVEIGAIILGEIDYPNPEKIRFLVDIGRIAGLVISATLQSQIQHWQQKQLALVRSVTAQVSQITDLNILTHKITELIQQSFNYYYVAVFLTNEKTHRLQFKASAGLIENEKPNFECGSHPGFALGEHIIGHVAETGREIIANDVSKESRYKQVNSLSGTKSEVVLPLINENHVFGVFDVQSNQLGAFDENDLIVLHALADNIAIAIENTRLVQTVQIRAAQLTAVSEISRAITSILDVDDLLQRIVNLIHERFGFPFVHLYTIDPVKEMIVFKAGGGQRAALYSDANITFDLGTDAGIIPWVVKHCQTKRVNNVNTDPLFEDSPFAELPTGSEMTVPLFFGGSVLGVLDIQSTQKNAFTPEDQQVIETLGDNIAISIRNARLYRSEKWRRQVAESLRDIAGLLSENTALEDVLDAILKQLHISLPCDVAGIWLFDQDATLEKPIDSQELHLAAYQTGQGYPAENIESMTYVPDAWVRAALTQEQPTIRKPDDPIGPVAVQFNMDKNYSAIAAPLHTGDEILGMLTLTNHEPGRYGQESKKITSAFASYAAIGIKNARLFIQSQEQAWVSTILLQVTQATQSQTSIKALADTIVRLTPMVVGVKGCALLLANENSNVFSLQAMYGVTKSEKEVDISKPVPLKATPFLNELGLFREPIIVKNPKEELSLPEEYFMELESNTMVLLPVTARENILGALVLVCDTDSPHSANVLDIINEERMKIIQGIIQQTAVGIENLRLLESRQEEAYISTVLLQVAQAVVSNAELSDTLDAIVNIMPILVGIDSCAIYQWDKSTEAFKTSFASIQGATKDQDLLGINYDTGEFPMLDAVFNNNRPIVYPFTDTILPPDDWDLILPDEDQIDPLPILQSQYPLLMGFPLFVKDEVYGVLLAQDENIATNPERRFELLWGIAQQTSLAIQNDQLNKEMLDRQRLEREFQLARDIQQTFLPDQIPDTPGWEMDVRWETARQVGGDFYDYFLLPDGRLAFVIADVSDKGLAASLYMTVTRTLIRAASLESTSPAETLEHVNDLLLVNSPDGLFVTTFYGVLNLENGLLTYTIAGHNPPILIRYKSKEVYEFKKGGIALGALPDITLGENTIHLGVGDCLLLYTDGVTEAFNVQDQMYGSGRLMQILHSMIGKPASNVLEILEKDQDSFRGEAPLSDDTTMLAICRKLSFTDENRNIRSS